jgi:hypothetical protein
MNTKTQDPNLIIERLGGTVKTAELCDVSNQAVSQWRTDGIPRARIMYLRVVRPDVFDDEEVDAGDTAKVA